MSEENESSGETEMTEEAASRIQAHADRTGENQGFKSRAQSAAAKNSSQEGESSGGEDSSSESGSSSDSGSDE
jgi:hypothetical protein